MKIIKFINTLPAKLRNSAKKSQLIVSIYHWFKLFLSMSTKDMVTLYKDMRKTRLLFKVKPYTMSNYPKLSMLYELAYRLEKGKISGSIVECGVYNGGSAAVMADIAKQNSKRHVWLFDSWEGWPEPDDRDYYYKERYVPDKGGCLGFEKKVNEVLFRRLRLDNTRVHLVKGWFEDTLPNKEIGVIALLHLDCNLYKSVKRCLEQLYDDVMAGGYIVIDDYGQWKGCEEAVNEFVESRGLKVKIVKIDDEAVYIKKI